MILSKEEEESGLKKTKAIKRKLVKQMRTRRGRRKEKKYDKDRKRMNE